LSRGYSEAKLAEFSNDYAIIRTCSMEGEGLNHIDRRQFLKGAVEMAIGGAISGGGVVEVGMGGSKIAEIQQKARKEVQGQGITPPDPEALRAARQILDPCRIEDNPLVVRNVDEILQARETLVQQAKYDKAYKERRKQLDAKEDRSALREGSAFLAIPAGVPLFLRGMVRLLYTAYIRDESPAPAPNPQHPREPKRG
jgi:hypothetical protein